MPHVQVQFHVDPQELISLAFTWAREHDFRVVLEQFFPDYQATEADLELDMEARTVQTIDRVALCRAAPNLSASTTHEFVSVNFDCLFLTPGPRILEGLRESTIAGFSSDPEILRVWRAMIRRAKLQMHKGAMERNPMSGAERHSPSHLHTLGAHALAAQGMPMLAGGGWVEYAFDDLPAAAVRIEPATEPT